MLENDNNKNPAFEVDNYDDDEFSLQSILAEYKGSAFIDGDKKTPSDILEERTRRIIMEANEGGLENTELLSYEDIQQKSENEEFLSNLIEDIVASNAVKEAPEPDVLETLVNTTDHHEQVNDQTIYNVNEENQFTFEDIVAEYREKTSNGSTDISIEEEHYDTEISTEKTNNEPAINMIFSFQDESESNAEQETIELDYNHHVFEVADAVYSDSEEEFSEPQLKLDGPAADIFDVSNASENVEKIFSKEDKDGNMLFEEPIDSDNCSDLYVSTQIELYQNPVSDDNKHYFEEDYDDYPEPEIKDEETLFFENYHYNKATTQNIDTKSEDFVSVSSEDSGPEDNEYNQEQEILCDYEKEPELAIENHGKFIINAVKIKTAAAGLVLKIVNSKFFEPEISINDLPEPDEPEYQAAAESILEREAHISKRTTLALVISFLMALFTIIYNSAGHLPFRIASDPSVFSAILLFMQLAVMLLGIETLIRGAESIFRGEPGAETLILFSCIITYIAAFHYIRKSDIDSGIPFCCVSAFSIAFAMLGDKLHFRAMAISLKTATATANPAGIISDYSTQIDRVIVKKRSQTVTGFYNNLVETDPAEMTYRYFAPFLIFASFFFSIITSIGEGRGVRFLYSFSAMAAASASFSSVLAFSFPFYRISRRARKLGAAIAGWSGADALHFSDGLRVTDDDIFPNGTLSLSGVKIFEEIRPEKAIRYTSSLVITSGSDLTKTFSDLLSNQQLAMVRVDDFECYEGGIGGLIRGEKVLVGSAAFMNLKGIRVPQQLNMKNAIFTAINDELVAVFTVNYIPVGSVQNALISILKSRSKLFFTVRDFNVTPLLIQQKFKVNTDNIEYLPVHDSYAISDEVTDDKIRTEAVLCREGLGPFAEAYIGARRLRSAVLISTIISIASAIAGVLLMFLLCWQGGFAALNPVSLLLYMLVMLAVIIMIGYLSIARK